MWRQQVLTGVLCGVVGIVLGHGNGTRISAGMGDKFSLASDARYSRAMFCFAPPDRALPAAEAHLQRLAGSDGADGNELIRRERVFATSVVATLEQRSNSDKAEAAWVDAQKACRLAEYRDCSRDWLTRLTSTVLRQWRREVAGRRSVRGREFEWGCGFLFGSVAAFSTLASWTDWPLCCAAAVLVGLLVAFLAARFGDSLWKAIIRFMSWW